MGTDATTPPTADDTTTGGDGKPARRRGPGRPSKAERERAAEAARIIAEATEAAKAGATIAYTLAGAGVQVVGFSIAGFVMQANAEAAGAVIERSAKGTRFYGAFQRLGQGSELGAFIAGPMLAEAYARMPMLRPRLLPILGVMVPPEALEQIVAVYPPPDAMPAEGSSSSSPAGEPGMNGADPAQAQADAAAERWPG